MPRKNLTDLAVKAAPIPEKGTATLWDTILSGFGVRVSAKGTRTFIVLIDSGRRQSIGHYPRMTLSEARTEAKRILAEKTLGKVRPKHTAFEDARDEYLAEREPHLRPLTYKLYKRHLTVHYPFKRQSVGDITPRQIVVQLNKLNDTPSEKEHAYRIGRTFFKWCETQHIIDRSPMDKMAKPPKGKSRERVLTDEELKAVYLAVIDGTTTFYRYVGMLITTGQRRTETSYFDREWFTDDTITIPDTVTKNKLEHTFPYGAHTKAILDKCPRLNSSTYLFPSSRSHVRGKETTVISGFSEAKRDLDKLTGVYGWTLHDLRRTFTTNMQRLGIPKEVRDKLINHVSETQSPLDATYNRYGYEKEMKEAIDKYDQFLHNLIA